MQSLGDRMKSFYEDRFRFKLLRRLPVILRLDGKSFHTLTKKYCEKEEAFDYKFIATMQAVAYQLCESIQGVKSAYVQSDEISILLTDYDDINTDAYFDYNIQKLVSISAAIASVEFTKLFIPFGDRSGAYFDARSFNIPKEEVNNYFIWRQQDWIRNSVHMYVRSMYSHKEIDGKNQSQQHDLIHAKGKNWADLPNTYKNGTFIHLHKLYGWVANNEIIFTQNRHVFDEYLYPEEKKNNE